MLLLMDVALVRVCKLLNPSSTVCGTINLSLIVPSTRSPLPVVSFPNYIGA